MSEKLESDGNWYCRNCGYLPWCRVTFSETCDECHQPVEWHTNEQQDEIGDLKEKISTIRNETIEECAKLCERERCRDWSAAECALQIRGMKEA